MTSKKGGLFVFLAGAFGFSWGLWALMIFSQRDLLPFRVPTHWIGSFGPAFGAVVAVAWSEGRPGLRSLLRRFLLWRAGTAVWLVSLVGIAAAYAAAFGLYALISGGSHRLVYFKQWPELVLYFFVIMIIGGPLGEEPGWRGFLQPYLQERMNPFWACSAVGLIWTAWHVPLVWLEGAAQKGESILAFGLMVMPMAFVFGWVYNRSGGSLLLQLLLHTSINTVSYMIVPVVFGWMKGDELLDICFICTLWGAAASLVLFSRRTFFKKSCNGSGPSAVIQGRS